MKQEILEEAAKRTEFERYGEILTNYTKQRPAYNLGFNNGAKWQQERSYSKEEVKRLAFNFYYDMSHKMGVAENLISENATNIDLWFEQFKKK